MVSASGLSPVKQKRSYPSIKRFLSPWGCCRWCCHACQLQLCASTPLPIYPFTTTAPTESRQRTVRRRVREKITVTTHTFMRTWWNWISVKSREGSNWQRWINWRENRWKRTRGRIAGMIKRQRERRREKQVSATTEWWSVIGRERERERSDRKYITLSCDNTEMSHECMNTGQLGGGDNETGWLELNTVIKREQRSSLFVPEFTQSSSVAWCSPPAARSSQSRLTSELLSAGWGRRWCTQQLWCHSN